MKRFSLLALMLVVASCGGSDSTPTPTPVPAPRPAPLIPLTWGGIPAGLLIAVGETYDLRLTLSISTGFTFSITRTNSRVKLGQVRHDGGAFIVQLTGLSEGPDTIRITASAPGYESAVAEVHVTVLSRREPVPPPPGAFANDPRFDRSYWRAMAFNAYQCPHPGTCEDGTYEFPEVSDRVLWVLPARSPDFVIITHDDAGNRTFTDTQIRQMRLLIPRAVQELTGETYQGRISTAESGSRGFVRVLIKLDRDLGSCGTALIGATDNLIRLSDDERCTFDSLVMHEVGHVLGFYHVPFESHMMYRYDNPATRFSNQEQFHGQLAYLLGRGHPYTEGFSSSSALTEAALPGEPVLIECGPEHLRH